jgi:hypothetical protein
MNAFVRLLGRLAPLFAALTIAGSAAAGPPMVSSPAIARAGIVVARLRAVHRAPSLAALGVVLDPAPLIRLRGRIESAEAAVAAARDRLALAQKLSARSAQLYGQERLISALAYEKAKGEVSAAAIALASARARRTALLAETGAIWGAAMAAALRTNGAPLPQLASGTAMLVGLSLPPGVRLAAPPRQTEGETAGTRFALNLIGPVPGMLGGYPGQSFLYEAAAMPGVPIGATVSASLPTGPQRMGALVPWSAVLWQGGQALVLRAGSGNRFEPVPIATDMPAAGGYFVSAALAAGDRVVVHGAALLLGAGGQAHPDGGED